MRVLRIELYGDEPGHMPVLVPVDDLTVIIARNGVGKTPALEAIEGLLTFRQSFERHGRGGGVDLFGWLHVRLNVADGPSSDWPWFRKLLALGFPGDVGSDIPDLDWVLGGPERSYSVEEYEADLRRAGLTAEQDQSWDMVCERAHHAARSANDSGMSILTTSLVGGDEIEGAIELFPGGNIDLVVSQDPDSTSLMRSDSLPLRSRAIVTGLGGGGDRRALRRLVGRAVEIEAGGDGRHIQADSDPHIVQGRRGHGAAGPPAAGRRWCARTWMTKATGAMSDDFRLGAPTKASSVAGFEHATAREVLHWYLDRHGVEASTAIVGSFGSGTVGWGREGEFRLDGERPRRR